MIFLTKEFTDFSLLFIRPIAISLILRFYVSLLRLISTITLPESTFTVILTESICIIDIGESKLIISFQE